MKKEFNLKITVLLIIAGFFSFCSAQNWTLVWSDEFNTPGLPDTARWSYDVGGNGWGNNELQYYTEGRSENARIEDTALIIELRKEKYSSNNYTSARLVTKSKGDWLYGRVEVRAKLPKGKGTWPAIWMLPTDWAYGGWPSSGEIDIMEHVGYDQGIIHATVHTDALNHTKGTQVGKTIPVNDCSTQFHVYAVEWYPDRIDAFVDNVKYFTFINRKEGYTTWPFDKRFHLILNTAFGGSWGGAEGIDSTLESALFYVDYVRVYKQLTVVPTEELVIDGGFDKGLAEWQEWSNSGTEAVRVVNNGHFEIMITNPGVNDWDLQLSQSGKSLIGSHKYRFSFNAWAQSSRTITARINMTVPPHDAYFAKELKITASPQTFVFEFTMKDPGDIDARVEFDFGKSTVTAFIDDVSLKDITSETGINKQQFFSNNNFSLSRYHLIQRFTGNNIPVPGYNLLGKSVAYKPPKGKSGSVANGIYIVPESVKGR